MPDLKERTARGAIVFFPVFSVSIVASPSYPDTPPGRQIYDSLNLPTLDYLVLGVPATTLIVATSNAVIFGAIAWLAFAVAEKARNSV